MKNASFPPCIKIIGCFSVVGTLLIDIIGAACLPHRSWSCFWLGIGITVKNGRLAECVNIGLK